MFPDSLTARRFFREIKNGETMNNKIRNIKLNNLLEIINFQK